MRPVLARSRLYAHRRRYIQIVTVLSRHGLRSLVDQLGLGALVPFERGFPGRRRRGPRQAQPAHLRMALEELGTTFIKLGQILSTREDLVTPAYAAELAKLREQVLPVPLDDIIRVIETSFDQPLEHLFAEFDRTPLAAASIGQVHAALLPGGTRVVVKVQKPGIAEQVEEDLAILQHLARFAQRRSPLAEVYDLPALVDEFGWTLRSELDYLREGQNADQFRRDFAGSNEVVIPRVFWERTNRSVITLERIDGIHVDDLERLEAAGIDRVALARRAASVILEQVFVHRFFHADPHPGNFAVLPDGRIAAFDFGMVGRIDDATRDALLTVLVAIQARDAEGVIDGLAGLSIIRHGSDRVALRRDVQHLLDRYAGVSLRDYSLTGVFQDVMALARRRWLQMPAEFSLLLKTLVMYEGLGRRLDPGFNPLEVAAPYVRRAVLERYLPRAWLPDLLAMGDDVLRLAVKLPRRLDRLLTRGEQGDLEVAMRVVDAEVMLQMAQALVNRVVAAILTASSLLTVGLILTAYHPAWLVRWLGPLLGLGILATVIATAVLVFHMLRGRRHIP